MKSPLRHDRFERGRLDAQRRGALRRTVRIVGQQAAETDAARHAEQLRGDPAQTDRGQRLARRVRARDGHVLSPAACPRAFVQRRQLLRQGEDQGHLRFGDGAGNRRRGQRDQHVGRGCGGNVDAVEPDSPARDAGRPVNAGEAGSRKIHLHRQNPVVLLKRFRSGNVCGLRRHHFPLNPPAGARKTRAAPDRAKPPDARPSRDRRPLEISQPSGLRIIPAAPALHSFPGARRRTEQSRRPPAAIIAKTAATRRRLAFHFPLSTLHLAPGAGGTRPRSPLDGAAACPRPNRLGTARRAHGEEKKKKKIRLLEPVLREESFAAHHAAFKSQDLGQTALLALPPIEWDKQNPEKSADRVPGGRPSPTAPTAA